MAEQINIPKFDYISQKNTYSGSIGNFRYKVFPQKKDEIDTVVVAAVYHDHCFEVEEEAARTIKCEFEYSKEGLEQAENWLRENYSQESNIND